MASTIKGITVSIGGDTTNLKKSLDSVDKTSKDLQRELNLVNRELKFNPDSATLLAQKQEILAEKVNATREKLNKLNEVQEQVERQAKSGDLGAEEYRAYQREVEKTKSQLGYLENELGKTGEKFNEVQRRSGNVNFKNAEDKVDHLKGKFKDLADDASKNLDAFSKKAEKIGDGLDKAGGVLNKTSAAGAAVLAGSVASFKDLDNGYDTIVKKTGATNDKLEKLKAIADDLFSNNSFDMQAIGSAIGEINTRFGYTDEKLKSVTETYLQFAKINDTDVSQSVAKSSQIVQAWNLSAEQIPGLLGLITGKAQETGISADVLMDKVLANNATFKEMGLSLEESVGLMAQFEKNGVNDSTALAALKAAVKNATKEGKSLSEALQENVADIKNAKTDTEALQAATKLFGSKGAAEMANAIREGRINFDDLSSSMEDYKDTVKNTYEGTLDPLEKSKKGLNNLKLAGAELANVALKEGEPLIDDVVKGIKDITEWIKKLNPEQKQMLIKAIEIVAVAGPAVKITGGIAKGISSIASVASSLIPKLVGATGAQWSLNAAMDANPAGAVAAAIGGLIAVIGLLVIAGQDGVKISYELSDAQKTAAEKIDEIKRSYDEYRESKEKALSGIHDEFKYYEDLWDELDKIVDKNGKVKEGYEDRAKFITNELGKVTGKEIEWNGNVVESYDKIRASIEKTLKVKEAEATLSGLQPAYSEAKSNMGKKKQYLAEQWNAYQETYNDIYGKGGLLEQLDAAYKRVNAAKAKGNPKELTEAKIEYENLYKKLYVDDGENKSAVTRLREYKNAYDTLKKQIADYQRTISHYESLSVAVVKGGTKEIGEALYITQNDFITAKDGNVATLAEQTQKYKKNYDEMVAAVKSGVEGITQADVDTAKALYDRAQAEFNAYAQDLGNRLIVAMKNYSELEKKYKEGDKTVSKEMLENAKTTMQQLQTEYDKLPATAKSSTQKAVNAVKNEKGNFSAAGAANGAAANNGTANAMKSGGALSKIGVAASQVVNFIRSKASNFLGAGNNLGQYITEGFANGMVAKKVITKIWSATKNIASNTIISIKKFLGIQSPSKEAEKLGQFFGMGFVNGIEQNQAAARKAAQNLSGAAKSSLSLGAFDYSGIKNTYTSIGKLRSSGIAKTQSRVNNINNSTSKSINGGVNVTINQAKLDTDADVERMGEKLADIIIRKGMEWG